MAAGDLLADPTSSELAIASGPVSFLQLLEPALPVGCDRRPLPSGAKAVAAAPIAAATLRLARQIGWFLPGPEPAAAGLQVAVSVRLALAADWAFVRDTKHCSNRRPG